MTPELRAPQDIIADIQRDLLSFHEHMSGLCHADIRTYNTTASLVKKADDCLDALRTHLTCHPTFATMPSDPPPTEAAVMQHLNAALDGLERMRKPLSVFRPDCVIRDQILAAEHHLRKAGWIVEGLL